MNTAPANIKLLLRLFCATMLIFVVQKLYFLLATWGEGAAIADVLPVLWHGLKLDSAVTAYTLVVPLLVSLVGAYTANRWTVRILRPYYIIISLLLAIIVVVDAGLYPFWHFKLDASVFIYADKPKDAMASVSAWFILGRLLLILLWWAMCSILYWRCLRSKDLIASSVMTKVCTASSDDVNRRGIIAKLMPAVLHIVLVAVLVLTMRGGLQQGTNNVSVAYYSDNQYLNHAAVNPVFSMIYSLGKQKDFASQYQYYDEQQRASIMRGIYDIDTSDGQRDTLLTTARPDIILIVWEGCCEAMVQSIGGKTTARTDGTMTSVTPWLDKMYREGVAFSNCYANSFRTDRGLVCLMAGYLGLTDNSLMKIPEKNQHLPALPLTLRDNGYETTFWYGGDITFTNMGGYMRQAGFSRTVSDNDFTANQRTTDWGVPDDILLDAVADDYLSKASTPGHPSFHAIMTLSSHEPWDVPAHTLKDKVCNAFQYTDSSIGHFIARLQKSPRWANTLVIITADHGASIGERYAREIIHIPMVWTGGAVRRPMVVDPLMNQSDLAATLLGQLGIRHDNFCFSRDVLSSRYTYHTATHAYNNGISFIDSTGVTTYDNDAQRVIAGPDAQREQRAKATQQTLYKTVGGL